MAAQTTRDIKCPTCGAQAGKACRSVKSNKPMSDNHAARCEGLVQTDAVVVGRPTTDAVDVERLRTERALGRKPTLQEMLDAAQIHEMTPDEIEAQRQSWVRGMTASCEHGELDFEQCPKCQRRDGQSTSET